VPKVKYYHTKNVLSGFQFGCLLHTVSSYDTIIENLDVSFQFDADPDQTCNFTLQATYIIGN